MLSARYNQGKRKNVSTEWRYLQSLQSWTNRTSRSTHESPSLYKKEILHCLKRHPYPVTPPRRIPRESNFHPRNSERESFRVTQNSLFNPTFLIHVDAERPSYVDLDISKESGVEAMVYHVKDWSKASSSDFPPRPQVQPIIFFSRLLNSAEIHHWPTELNSLSLSGYYEKSAIL